MGSTADMAAADTESLGPEDSARPDRARQQRHPDGAAAHERDPSERPEQGRSDAGGRAWESEATFEDHAEPNVTPYAPPRDGGDVHPIVHAGE
jgi:hypothetical protein